MGLHYFTPHEVDVLIPKLEHIFAEIETCKKRAEKLASKIMAGRGSAVTVDVVEGQVARSQIEFLTEGVQEFLRHIQDLGGITKDLEIGLVDFPSQMNGRDVWLCWKKGERQARYWHPLDAGYSERKILPHLALDATRH